MRSGSKTGPSQPAPWPCDCSTNRGAGLVSTRGIIDTNGGSTPALLIPDAAVRTDQARKIVLVVGKDDTVAVKPVEPGPLVGGLRAIRSGISANDRIVIQGVQFAQPGAKVRPRVTRIALKEAATIAPLPAGAPSASQATVVGN